MNGKVRKGRKMRKRLIIGMIVTKGAEMTLEQETDYTLEAICSCGRGT